MSNATKITGISIVRNAEILNYPFVESVESLLPLCDEFLINCGKSDDSTLQLCLALEQKYPDIVKVIQTSWGAGTQKAGLELSAQTNKMIEKASGDWCFYIQADEVLHESDLRHIESQIEAANKMSHVDGLVFDYLHFYTSYEYQIEGRNWYRREVRAFKNNRKIQSFVDAQGFRKQGKRLKVLSANARVFHYGYVRSPEMMKQKSIEMSKWWGENPEMDISRMQPVNHVGLKAFTSTHPKVMKDKMEREQIKFRPQDYKRRWNKQEIKNLVTIWFERFAGFRIGEFKNYELVKT